VAGGRMGLRLSARGDVVSRCCCWKGWAETVEHNASETTVTIAVARIRNK
jgi:hypothetical protein